MGHQNDGTFGFVMDTKVRGIAMVTESWLKIWGVESKAWQNAGCQGFGIPELWYTDTQGSETVVHGHFGYRSNGAPTRRVRDLGHADTLSPGT